MKRLFEKFAENVSIAMGSPWVFIGALGIIGTWAASGPALGYSEQWQLVINSFTTIVTFLMVFVIQNTQNRDFQALQIKLDALLLASDSPLRVLASLHNLSESDLRRMEKAIEQSRGKHDVNEIVQLLEKQAKKVA